VSTRGSTIGAIHALIHPAFIKINQRFPTFLLDNKA
jgi:hypothetical protein